MSTSLRVSPIEDTGRSSEQASPGLSRAKQEERSTTRTSANRHPAFPTPKPPVRSRHWRHGKSIRPLQKRTPTRKPSSRKGSTTQQAEQNGPEQQRFETSFRRQRKGCARLSRPHTGVFPSPAWGREGGTLEWSLRSSAVPMGCPAFQGFSQAGTAHACTCSQLRHLHQAAEWGWWWGGSPPKPSP